MTPRAWLRPLLAAAACAVCVAAAAQPAAPATSADTARSDFFLHCAGCHRFDGRGSPRHGIPDFRGSVGWFTHLPEGREYLVRVPGSSQSQLSDAELAVVLNWMLHEFSAAQLPRDFQPYTAQEVTRVRTPPYQDIVPVRHALERALTTDGRVLAEYTFGADRKP